MPEKEEIYMLPRVLRSLVCAAVSAGLFSFWAAAAVPPPEIELPSAVLAEFSTGKVLFEKDADIPLPPASVTKIMTSLLTVEAIERGDLSLDEIVTVSDAAASMTGSRVFISRGEKISVHELLKSIMVSSGNDACVAMAERIAGSQEGFVAMMNERAGELGMTSTHFENCTGLDSDGHLTTARDIVVMSRELMKHPMIFDYTTIWQDSIRGGTFTLTNTNRLIHDYDGANGLKTGSTSKAGYCLSAAAERDGMELIAVVLAAPSSDIRFASARKLLDYGFAAYCLEKTSGADVVPQPVSVHHGQVKTLPLSVDGDFSCVIDRENQGRTERRLEIPDVVEAPVEAGAHIGDAVFLLDGAELGRLPVTAAVPVGRADFGWVLTQLIRDALML